jgi:hypothetical protein
MSSYEHYHIIHGNGGIAAGAVGAIAVTQVRAATLRL